MAKRKYIAPEVKVESLEVDSCYALGCGSAIHHNDVMCISYDDPDDFEVLTDTWGLDPSTSFDSEDFSSIVFSSSQTCSASCYHGPFDSFFAS